MAETNSARAYGSNSDQQPSDSDVPSGDWVPGAHGWGGDWATRERQESNSQPNDSQGNPSDDSRSADNNHPTGSSNTAVENEAVDNDGREPVTLCGCLCVCCVDCVDCKISRYGMEDNVVITPWELPPGDTNPPVTPWVFPSEPEVPEKDPLAENPLAAKTRSFDTTFYDKLKVDFFVPYRLRYQTLHRAHILAQDTLWTAMRDWWPRRHRELWLESPREVAFGGSDLDAIFGCGSKKVSYHAINDYNVLYNGMSAKDRETVNEIIHKITGLRNLLAHPGVPGYGGEVVFNKKDVHAKVIAELLMNAQKLAVILGDTKRADKLRGLRDHFQGKVSDIYDEFRYQLPTWSQGVARWPLHHQRTMMWYDDKMDNTWEQCPQWLQDLFRKWEAACKMAGDQVPDYIARLGTSYTSRQNSPASGHGREKAEIALRRR